ncbi:MAG: hypothetical protein U0228_21350 [Myxococcaceae bacterium]
MLMLALVLSVAPVAVDQPTPAFKKAYDAAFDRLKGVSLSDTQTRIQRLGAKGKSFQGELDALRKRQGEVSDALVKAIELARQAGKSDEAVKVLQDADARAVKLLEDVKKLNERLTAAGAPVIEPGPPADPNARD